MDKDRLKVHCQTNSREHECHREKEGYVEALSAEVPKASIRRSSRLQTRKNASSCSQDVFGSSHNSSKYTKKSLKASLDRENSISESKIEENNKHQLHRNENNGGFSADTASKSSTAVPSFKYHVRASDGIRLVVDLNFKRSDWLRSMEKAVCVCQNHHKPGFESFRQEVECVGDKNNLKIGSSDKTTASDASMNSYVQNNFSLKSVRESGKTLPSVVEKEATIISSREFSTRDGYRKSLNSIVPDDPAEPSSFLNKTVSGSKGRSKNDESSELSDFSSHQKGSSCSRTGKICSENLLTSTIEVNQETGGNKRLSTIENRERIKYVEEMERINYAEEMEVSGRQKNTVVVSAYDDWPKRRKHNDKSDYMHGQCHERILRSTKVLGGQILERRGLVMRRSSRLLYK